MTSVRLYGSLIINTIMHHVYVIPNLLITTIMQMIPTPLYPLICPINVIACIDGIRILRYSRNWLYPLTHILSN